MGLHVSAYRSVVAASQELSGVEHRRRGHHQVYNHEGLCDRSAPFVQDQWVQLDETGAPPRAWNGSYSSYGVFRNELSLAIIGKPAHEVWDAVDNPFDYPVARTWPLVELIYFADDHGFLGPEACARLAADFVASRDKLVAYEARRAMPSLMAQSYDRFAAAFAYAADGGAVCFG